MNSNRQISSKSLSSSPDEMSICTKKLEKSTAKVSALSMMFGVIAVIIVILASYALYVLYTRMKHTQNDLFIKMHDTTSVAGRNFKNHQIIATNDVVQLVKRLYSDPLNPELKYGLFNMCYFNQLINGLANNLDLSFIYNFGINSNRLTPDIKEWWQNCNIVYDNKLWAEDEEDRWAKESAYRGTTNSTWPFETWENAVNTLNSYKAESAVYIAKAFGFYLTQINMELSTSRSDGKWNAIQNLNKILNYNIMKDKSGATVLGYKIIEPIALFKNFYESMNAFTILYEGVITNISGFQNKDTTPEQIVISARQVCESIVPTFKAMQTMIDYVEKPENIDRFVKLLHVGTYTYIVPDEVDYESLQMFTSSYINDNKSMLEVDREANDQVAYIKVVSDLLNTPIETSVSIDPAVRKIINDTNFTFTRSFNN
jgi:hypothetical protein